MDLGHVHPENEPDDMDQLLTTTHDNLVAAVNELFADIQGEVAVSENIIAITLGAASPSGLPTLPVGAIITGAQLHVSTLYPSSTVIELGDHSGGSGASAPTSISSSIGTATSTGDYNAPLLHTPVGALVVTITGGAGGSGAGVLLVRYMV